MTDKRRFRMETKWEVISGAPFDATSWVSYREVGLMGRKIEGPASVEITEWIWPLSYFGVYLSNGKMIAQCNGPRRH